MEKEGGEREEKGNESYLALVRVLMNHFYTSLYMQGADLGDIVRHDTLLLVREDTNQGDEKRVIVFSTSF